MAILNKSWHIPKIDFMSPARFQQQIKLIDLICYGVIGDFLVSGELLVDDGDWLLLLAGAGVIWARTLVAVSNTVQMITITDIELYFR